MDELTPYTIHEADHGHTIVSSEERITLLDEDTEANREKLKKFNAGAFSFESEALDDGEVDGKE